MKKLAVILLAFLFCALAAHADGPPAGFYNPSMGGAPSNSNYLLFLNDPLLDHSRVLAATSPITLTDSGTAHGHFTISLGVVPATLGGSGQSSLANGFDAFANSTAGAAIAAGDILYYDGTHWHRLPISTDGKYLSLASGLPTWATPPSGAPAAAQYILGTANGSLANGMVLTAGTGIGVTNVPGTSSTIAIDSTVATLTGVQILTNKTLTSPALNTSLVLNGSAHNGTITWPDWVAARAISIPDPGASAAFVLTQGAQTIAGATTFSVAPVLTSGTLSVGGFTVTVPGATDTLANLTGVQVLSNKELSSPSFTSGGNIVLKQTSGNYTLTWANPAAARAYSITDVGGSADFAMKTGAYTAGGVAYGDGNKLVVSAASGSADIPLCSGTSGTGAPTFEVLKIVGGGTNNGSLGVTAGTIYYGDGTKLIGLAPTTNNGWVLSYNTSTSAPAWAAPASGSGTVTSVTFTGDGTVLSSTPSSAVTTTGTVTASLLNCNQYQFLGRSASGAGAPSYQQPNFSYLAGNATAAQGGTGLATLTAHNVMIGEGTSNVAFAAPTATVGVPLVSANSTTDPAFGTASVAGGGTGATTLTIHGVLIGNTTSAVNITAAGANGYPLVANTSADPTFQQLGLTTGVTGVLPIANGGTNNNSLGVNALGIYAGDGSKVTQVVGTASQQFRVNAGGTAVEAFTPAAAGGAIEGICQGRLTTTSGTPVDTTNRTAITTIYFTPFRGDQVATHSGSAWTLNTFTEQSLSVPATTSTMYDVFIVDSTLALEAVAWTNDTTRATALVYQNGVLVKSGAVTRRYLGSFRTTAVSGQTEDSDNKRYIWNCYNRVQRNVKAVDTTTSWTYTTATWREEDNNSTLGVSRVGIVRGLDEDVVDINVVVPCSNNAANSFSYNGAGVGLTSSTVNSAQAFGTVNGIGNSNGNSSDAIAYYVALPGVGYYDYRWLEISSTGSVTTWYGSPQTYVHAGLTGHTWQ